MTTEQFVERAKAAAVPKTGEPQLGPIELAIVIAVLTTVASQLVGWCMSRLLHKDAAYPTRVQRARLRWLWVRPAVKRAIAEHPEAAHVDDLEIEDRVMEGLLAAGRSLTPGEFASLRVLAP